MKVTAPFTDSFEYDGKVYGKGQPMNLPVDVVLHHADAGIRFHDEDGNHLTLSRLVDLSGVHEANQVQYTPPIEPETPETPTEPETPKHKRG